MKRILILALAGCFMFASMASAKEFQVQGQFWQGLEWRDNLDFTEDNDEDDFEAKQRVRTYFHYVASEQVRAVLGLEIDSGWGADGGGLGTDEVDIEVKHAYVDFTWGMVQVRTGLQGFITPGAVAGSMILDEDAAGITASMEFNETFGLTLAWMQLADDGDVTEDAMDAFMVALPITTDNFKMTPFGIYAFMGDGSAGGTMAGPDAYAFWLGTDFMMTIGNFDLAADFNYGSLVGDNEAGEMDGFWIDGRVTYNGFETFTPSFIIWYGSGNDDDAADGYEVMPTISSWYEATSLGFGDAPASISRYMLANNTFDQNSDAPGAHASNPGLQATFAFGVEADFSFMENLDHTARIVFGMGTNDKDWGSSQWQLTTEDTFYELNFNTSYQLYESLELWNQIAYLGLDLDDEVGEEDAFRFALGLTYTY